MKWIVIASVVLAAAACVLFAASPREPRRGKSVVSNSPSSAEPTSENERTPLKLPLIDPHIVVLKSKRQLDLYSNGKVVRTYRVGLGFTPKGDKRTQGDGCTPEGEFYVCSKNPKSSYYLSLGLSYPNEEDAERGLREGLVSRAQRDQIVRAIRAKSVPPWNTKLGGEIFIHGNGSSSDWTFGCVALDNPDIKELFDVVGRGTPVTIKP